MKRFVSRSSTLREERATGAKGWQGERALISKAPSRMTQLCHHLSREASCPLIAPAAWEFYVACQRLFVELHLHRLIDSFPQLSMYSSLPVCTTLSPWEAGSPPAGVAPAPIRRSAQIRLSLSAPRALPGFRALILRSMTAIPAQDSERSRLERNRRRNEENGQDGRSAPYPVEPPRRLRTGPGAKRYQTKKMTKERKTSDKNCVFSTSIGKEGKGGGTDEEGETRLQRNETKTHR